MDVLDFHTLTGNIRYTDDNYIYTLSKEEDKLIIHVRSYIPSIRKARPIQIQVPDSIDYGIKFDHCFFDHRGLKDISALSDIDSSKIVSTEGMFHTCKNLVDISPLSSWKMNIVRDMHGMFFECRRLRDLSCLDGWNVPTDIPLHGFYAPYGHVSGDYHRCPIIHSIRIRSSVYMVPVWLQDRS